MKYYKNYNTIIFDEPIDIFPDETDINFIIINFNSPIDLGVYIVDSIHSIIFTDFFDSDITFTGDKNFRLNCIEFGENYNRNVDNLPTSKKIIFGKKFNQLVDNLPMGLEILVFDHFFNQCVDFLPNTLKSLSFGSYFNQSIDNLPDSIEILNLGFSFCNDLRRLPDNLRLLNLSWNYNKKILVLPSKLKRLKLSKYYKINSRSISRFKLLYLKTNFLNRFEFVENGICYF